MFSWLVRPTSPLGRKALIGPTAIFVVVTIVCSILISDNFILDPSANSLHNTTLPPGPEPNYDSHDTTAVYPGSIYMIIAGLAVLCSPSLPLGLMILVTATLVGYASPLFTVFWIS